MPEKKYISNQYCIPIQLGIEETKIDLGIQRDDEGENRSNRHPLYSEYSGIYWLWKNTTADYKGMLHHRRSFSVKPVPIKTRWKDFAINSLKRVRNYIGHHPYSGAKRINCVTNEEYWKRTNEFFKALPDLLNDYEVIVPSRFHYRFSTVQEAFDEVINRFILKCMGEIFEKDYPEYKKYFDKTCKSNRLYYSNMEIMKNEIFDEYCTFVFGIFDKIEENLKMERLYLDPLKERSLYRVFGYIGELLTNTFILRFKDNGGKVKELPLLFNAATKGNESIDFKTMQYK